MLLRWLVLIGFLVVGAPSWADDSNLVQALLARGDAASALARTEPAVSAGRASVRMRFLHGVALFDLQRNSQALAVFTALTQDYPQVPEPYNNIAALHARAGQWEMARQALETALRNDPSHRTARENLGDVHLQLALQAWHAAQSAERPDPALARKIRFATALADRNIVPTTTAP